MAWRLFDRDCIDLLIQWDNGSDDTWEAEEIMHKDMAPLVIQFWRKQGGHEKVTGLRKHQSRAMGDNLEEPQSKCQWIRYATTESTWENWDKVTSIALPQFVQ